MTIENGMLGHITANKYQLLLLPLLCFRSECRELAPSQPALVGHHELRRDDGHTDNANGMRGATVCGSHRVEECLVFRMRLPGHCGFRN